MRVLILGASGQLGVELAKKYEEDFDDVELYKSSSSDFDLSNYHQTKQFILDRSPNLIINCAAYTNVDDCEQHVDLAYKINAIGNRNIVLCANMCEASLVYISTDYVFDGNKSSPYTEFDTPCPLNVYGKSKLTGEQYTKYCQSNFYIIRTSWLYGKNGNNFVKTILKLAKENSILRIVDDQIGCPTDAKSLAEQILKIIQAGTFGTYHASCNGFCSWYQFASEIIKVSDLDSKIIPIKTEQYPLPAKRPKYSVLDNYILRLESKDIMPNWRDSLRDFLNQNPKETLI